MRKIDVFASLIKENDGTLSHRKIIALLFSLYVLVMIVGTFLSDKPDTYSDFAWFSVVGGALGISYIRQLVNFKK